MAKMRNARHARDGTVLNLTAIANLTIPCLSQSDKDGRDVLASHWLEAIQDFCRDTSLRLLSRVVAINVANLRFFPGVVIVTVDSCDEFGVALYY